MKYIDTHAHMNFSDYASEREALIQRTYDAETMVINVGIDKFSSQEIVEMAEKYPHLYAIIGLHPLSTVMVHPDSFSVAETFEEKFFENLLYQSKKIVGVGECGFDYFHNPKESKEIQEQAFRAQIEFAHTHNLPLMLHIRPSQGSYDAYEDTLEILCEYQQKGYILRGQAHFFAGTIDIAQSFLELNFYISFTGVITFANYDELVRSIPDNRILSETDSPYVAPVPYRGQRNEPVYVQEVVKKMADILNVSEESMRQRIMNNAQVLYRL